LASFYFKLTLHSSKKAGQPMFTRFRIPKTILWVLNLFLIFLFIFTLYRLITFFAFRPRHLSFGDIISPLLMGLRYDLRWISIVMLPIILLSMRPGWSPFYSAKNKKWWTWYLAIITFILFFFFAASFGSFSYNLEPLDAKAMNFVEDPKISLQMMWQTYPLIWMILGLMVAVLLFRWMYHKSHWQVIKSTDGKGIPYRRKFFVIAAFIMGLFIYGSPGWQPLKRSNSFIFKDSFKSCIAINPLQNFFSTLKGRRHEFNTVKAKDAIPVMEEWMGLHLKGELNYRRDILPGSASLESRPNIVLVLCESFSMYKSTMSGNPLNTTPYFDSLCRNGIFFEKCFSPHFSTARGLFALITGIPDAQNYKFSTRDSMAVQQRTIINHFEGYGKFYFLGGNPAFSNFDGLLNNIQGLQMYTEGKLKSPKVNVWGISDKNLFLEANEVFKRQAQPFFALVQTADNHRPFMIPEEDTDFVRISVDEELLKKYGFESVNEFNSFRYSDYCFRKFMEAARQENYFHNTIFVFIGDHGVAGNASFIYPAPWTDQRLTDLHVPLLFYAPHLLPAQKRNEVVSQIDVLPTIAGMVHQPYLNTTLGRDLLDSAKRKNFAFTTNTSGKIGMVTDDFYFTRNLEFPDEQLHPLTPDASRLSGKQKDSIRQRLSEFTSSFYETARWMIMNNRKE
jgi:phosphoglycerol transferase MdoB-like AlkP superfamily enzyme